MILYDAGDNQTVVDFDAWYTVYVTADNTVWITNICTIICMNIILLPCLNNEHLYDHLYEYYIIALSE